MKIRLFIFAILAGGVLGLYVTSTHSQSNLIFTDTGQLLTTGTVYSVALADLDGDNSLDAFTTTGFDSRIHLNRDSTGIFPFGSRVILSGNGTRTAALGDLNGDGKLDAVVGGPGPNRVWLNTSTEQVFSMSGTGQQLGNQYTFAVALSDLDGDGDLDLFEVNARESSTDAPGNKVWFNNGSGHFTDSGQVLGNEKGRAVALGDLDGDGDPDAFVANASSFIGTEADRVWLNDGKGAFTDSGQSLSPDPSTDVALADLDSDGDLDAVVGSEWPLNPKTVWLNNGNGIFTASGQSLPQANQVAVGDLDGDGDLDIYASISPHQQVWLNNGSGLFTDSGLRIENGSNFYPQDIALADLDRDGDLDTYVAGTTKDKVYLNESRQNFIPTDFVFLPFVNSGSKRK